MRRKCERCMHYISRVDTFYLFILGIFIIHSSAIWKKNSELELGANVDKKMQNQLF